ncbi:hypothetical protein VNO77_09117 [Canavalia gladiata]|uniref:Uncharacterized protein n=1 Tax=Canavalia gladiata TaxID=3824 RepID=A0AAN9M8Y3_CANGL
MQGLDQILTHLLTYLGCLRFVHLHTLFLVLAKAAKGTPFSMILRALLACSTSHSLPVLPVYVDTSKAPKRTPSLPLQLLE